DPEDYQASDKLRAPLTVHLTARKHLECAVNVALVGQFNVSPDCFGRSRRGVTAIRLRPASERPPHNQAACNYYEPPNTSAEYLPHAASNEHIARSLSQADRVST